MAYNHPSLCQSFFIPENLLEKDKNGKDFMERVLTQSNFQAM